MTTEISRHVAAKELQPGDLVRTQHVGEDGRVDFRVTRWDLVTSVETDPENVFQVTLVNEVTRQTYFWKPGDFARAIVRVPRRPLIETRRHELYGRGFDDMGAPL